MKKEPKPRTYESDFAAVVKVFAREVLELTVTYKDEGCENNFQLHMVARILFADVVKAVYEELDRMAKLNVP